MSLLGMYNLREIKHDPLQDDNKIIYENHNNNFISVCLSGSKSSAPQNILTSCRHIYIDAYIYRYIYIYVIYTRYYDMILCCKLVEYIESRPVDIKCCLIASRNTAKLWATHGYIHMWLQSFRIRHPFWRPQNRGRHWSHACSWATKYLWTKKERWFETAIVCKAAAKSMLH